MNNSVIIDTQQRDSTKKIPKIIAVIVETPIYSEILAISHGH